MKSLSFLGFLSAAVLMTAGAAYAHEDTQDKANQYNINQQNLSKRPYQHAPVESKKDNFEGATLINEEAPEAKKHKQMRLHMLGKRPYAEKNTD